MRPLSPLSLSSRSMHPGSDVRNTLCEDLFLILEYITGPNYTNSAFVHNGIADVTIEVESRQPPRNSRMLPSCDGGDYLGNFL